MAKMTLSEELVWRGFVNQTTLKDITVLDKEQLVFYWGVDPSADSLTVGNLAAAMMVRHFISHGHKAILLVGGATGLIGDPDGKKQERSLLSYEQLQKNIAGISEQYKTVFSGQEFTVVNNYDWFKDIKYMDFLRTIGKHFSMTQLLDREFVQSRIGKNGSGISYAEFSYSLIQGYDFLHLFREKGVTLQVCGADQWGNSVAGVEMIRKLEGKTAHVYSTPLVVNKATGMKFGKSEEGAIWLNESKTSTYEFYQFWLTVDDAGIEQYLKVYTLISPEEFDTLIGEFKAHPEKRAAQHYLAYEVTKLVYGESKADSAKKVTEVLFSGATVSGLDSEELEMLAKEIPTTTPQSVIDVLVETNLASSNSEARRLIEANAISINGAKITEEQIVTASSLVKKGKNSFALVR